jgi:hypothetical protein
MVTFDEARELVRQAEMLRDDLEDMLWRTSEDYDGSDPYNSWWTDKLEDLVVAADRRVHRRRKLLVAVSSA